MARLNLWKEGSVGKCATRTLEVVVSQCINGIERSRLRSGKCFVDFSTECFTRHEGEMMMTEEFS